MSIKNRLKIFIKSKGIPVTAFEKSINTANGYVNGISKGIGADKARAINRKYPNLNMDWLLTGEGEMELKNVEREESNTKDEYFPFKELESNIVKRISDNTRKDFETIKDLLYRILLDLEKNETYNELKKELEELKKLKNKQK